jgi:hypothetical protein
MGLTMVAMGALGAHAAYAQAPAEPAPAPAAEPMPPPPPPPPAAVAATPPPAPTPPTSTEAMPATRPDTLPPIDVGAWLRVAGTFQGAEDKKKLNDFQMSSAYVELHAGGKIHKNVGVTLNVNAEGAAFGSAGGNTAAVEDAIISFDFLDEFHLWAGHLLVPVDRANASGPFFMIPWNYPGVFGPPDAKGNIGFIGPKEGPSGRNNGAVVWGDINAGQVTYLAGVFDDGSVASHPLFSGRVRLALLDPEPGFWGNGSYFGDKDLLSIGVGAQYQKATMGKNWTEVNADVLFEKKLGGGSFFTAEGAFYHFDVDDGAIANSFYLLAAYATPTVGVGSIQPMVRYQGSTFKGDSGGTTPKNIDVGVAYLIKGPALRVVANYSHFIFAEDVTANALTLAAQAIFF